MHTRKTFAAAGVLSLALGGVVGCDEPDPTSWPASRVAVVVPTDAPDAVAWAAVDLQASIAEATGTEPELVAEAGDASARYLLLVGDGPWECPPLDDEQAYRIEETTHGGKPSLRLCGGGLLGRQYAVYAYLGALGFRSCSSFALPKSSAVRMTTA